MTGAAPNERAGQAQKGVLQLHQHFSVQAICSLARRFGVFAPKGREDERQQTQVRAQPDRKADLP
jgi:hypothetical protein